MMLLSSCRPACAPDATACYGGTLTRGFQYKPSGINPFFTTHTASASLVQLIFNGLVRINPIGEIEPDLARSWSLSEDSRIYTFCLREGVRFHDGRELTSRDVLFTYRALADPAVNSPFRESFDIVESFSAPGPYTFRVTLKEPSASFIFRMIRYIAPEHLLKDEDLSVSDFGLHPVGTGPFRFKEWKDDGRIILEANPDYYEGRPYLDKIIIKTYPDSKDVWVALMRGEVACAEFIEREDYKVIQKDPSFKAYAVAADYYYTLRYVLTDSVLSDKRVRRALAHAIDVEALVERVEEGYGARASGPFWPGSIGFSSDTRAPGYDTAKAMALLAEAGWVDSNGDGIRDKDGQELKLNVLFDVRNKTYEKLVMALRQQLQEVGIKLIAIAYEDDNVLTQEFFADKKIQAVLIFLFGGADPDQQAEDWSSEANEEVKELWGYDNDEVNRLFAEGRVTQDQGARKKIYQQIGRIVSGDQPACFLYFPTVFHAASDRFMNMDVYFNNVNMPNYTFKDVHLEESNR